MLPTHNEPCEVLLIRHNAGSYSCVCMWLLYWARDPTSGLVVHREYGYGGRKLPEGQDMLLL